MSWIECLASSGWIHRPIMLDHDDDAHFDRLFASRLPVEFAKASKTFALLASADETVWFLSALDYLRKNPISAFAWDEYQKICLDAAEDDEQEISEINKFWSRYTPLLLAVRSGYAYLAYDIESGCIVSGREPEFEHVERFADSFVSLAEDLCRYTKGQSCSLPWVDLMAT